MQVLKNSILLLTLVSQVTGLTGQTFFSKTGKITFLSQAPLEKIEGENHTAYVVFDASNGNMEWSVLIKGFQFEKALMQEHFNENYLESHKYPKAIFKGNVANYKDLNLEKDGEHPLRVTGNLAIHGVTKSFTGGGLLTVKGGKVTVAGAFDIVIADFNIEVPKVVRENVARTVNVKVSAELQKLK